MFFFSSDGLELSNIVENFVSCLDIISKSLGIFGKQVGVNTSKEWRVKVLSKDLISVLTVFKLSPIFLSSVLTYIVVFDQPGKTYRFTVVYHLMSTYFGTRGEVVLQTNEVLPIPSVTRLYSGGCCS